MRDFIVVVGQVLGADNVPDRFNINFYKVQGESKEDIENKIKSRIDFWAGMHIDVYIIDIIDLEETSKLRREVEFLGNYWLLPRNTNKPSKDFHGLIEKEEKDN